MAVQLTVTTRDVKRLIDLSDPARLREHGEPMPWSVMAELAELVPCDDVVYLEIDGHNRQVAASMALLDREVRTEPEVDPDPTDEIFWDNYWAWGCSYPERSGDYTSVLRYDDPSVAREDIDASTDFFGTNTDILIPLRPRGTVSHRILLWRFDGNEFTDREAELLNLIRPHLAAICDAGVRRRADEPDLTPRHRELMRLVATGLTNRQISRRLRISEGTVRKHLENIYARLDVTNRVAAVERVNLPESSLALRV
jgi:DNA-binding CsgD family transcriptional regulator